MKEVPAEGTLVILTESVQRYYREEIANEKFRHNFRKPGRWFSWNYAAAQAMNGLTYPHCGFIIFDRAREWEVLIQLGKCKDFDDLSKMVDVLVETGVAASALNGDVEVVTRDTRPTRRGRKHKMRLPLVYPIAGMEAVDG